MPDDVHPGKLGIRYIIVGMFLTILPLVLMFYHSYRMDSGTLVRLPVHITYAEKTKLGSTFTLKTPLNHIDTNTLTGHNNFMLGTLVYVFLSPGPNDIWYTYSISKSPPEHGCQIASCLVLKGRVHAVYKNIVDIRYQYESFVAQTGTADFIKQSTAQNPELVLSIGADGHATLHALILDGKNLAQPKISIPELFGFTHNIASTAPAR